MCGKVYLTHDELIEHRFSSLDKTPQQMQSSGHINSFFKRGAVQDDGDTLIAENDLNKSSTAETSAASETVTRKNKIDGGVDSKKVGSVLLLLLSCWLQCKVLLLTDWKEELCSKGIVRCPMYKVGWMVSCNFGTLYRGSTQAKDGLRA